MPRRCKSTKDGEESSHSIEGSMTKSPPAASSSRQPALGRGAMQHPTPRGVAHQPPEPPRSQQASQVGPGPSTSSFGFGGSQQEGRGRGQSGAEGRGSGRGGGRGGDVHEGTGGEHSREGGRGDGSRQGGRGDGRGGGREAGQGSSGARSAHGRGRGHGPSAPCPPSQPAPPQPVSISANPLRVPDLPQAGCTTKSASYCPCQCNFCTNGTTCNAALALLHPALNWVYPSSFNSKQLYEWHHLVLYKIRAHQHLQYPSSCSKKLRVPPHPSTVKLAPNALSRQTTFLRN